MNKRDVEGWEQLEWNSPDDEAIPLPEYRIDHISVWDRRYVPDKTPIILTAWIYKTSSDDVRYVPVDRSPIIPTGWMYMMANGDVVNEEIVLYFTDHLTTE